ncbi:MAG: ACP S-malonyltransferase [Saprospiraceae bacterium]|nr:ACP S-malonyltransferase [Saprospiraceae bacterium]MBK9630748.1 ACP S-malonyltransferase [Saprospiraceae bacterium]
MNNQAFIFPGQASQFVGMGKDLYENSPLAKNMFDEADALLGYKISEVMFEGTEDQLKQTSITQPSVFIHSLVSMMSKSEGAFPTAVAGHSLGEISALVAAGVLTFSDGLILVKSRADAMQLACDQNPGSMAAIVGLTDEQIESVCESITDEIVIPANYNCPGQLVISGSLAGLKLAEEKLLAAGAKRVILLQVGGAFHSPLMEPARAQLENAIHNLEFCTASCPVYQNVDAMPSTDPTILKSKLIRQLTAPVRWTQTMQNMISSGINSFVEVGGNGTVLSGFLKRIDRNIPVTSL